LDPRNGARIAASPLANTPAYKAGLDVDDVVRQMDGVRVGSAEDVAAVLKRHKPGDTIAVTFVDRAGATTDAKVTLAEDPQMEMVAAESAGSMLTSAQRAFRRAWLGQ
jgi:S1-C subfamily serine protease